MQCTCHTPDPIANTGGWDERCPTCNVCFACCICGWSTDEAPPFEPEDLPEGEIQSLLEEAELAYHAAIFRKLGKKVRLITTLAETFRKGHNESAD